jgi:hypothetical protein
MSKSLKDVIETLKIEGSLNREIIQKSLSESQFASFERFKGVFESINNNLLDQNSILKASIERIRSEGQLVRNTGTNSIKSVNTNLISIRKIFESIDINLKEQNTILKEVAFPKDTKENDIIETHTRDNEEGFILLVKIFQEISLSLKEQNSILKETLESQKRALELSSVGRTTIGTPQVPQAATRVATPATALSTTGRISGAGFLASIGTGLAGAGAGVLAARIRGLGVGLATFANPATIAGGTALVAFLAGLGGATWLFGEGANRVGQGFSEISNGLERLNEVGSRIQSENFVTTGRNLNTFLSEVSGFRSLFGGVITFLTGDLVKISEGVQSLNDLEVDNQKLRNAGSSLSAFFGGLGEASFWDRFAGAITTRLTPDLRNISSGLISLSDASKEIDPIRFSAMGRSLSVLYGPLGNFAGSGIWANFVGANAISDLSKGITELNKAEFDRLPQLAAAIESIPGPIALLAGGGILATFNRSGTLPDLASGITALNRTEVDRLGLVTEGLDSLTGPLLRFAGSNLITSLANLGASIADFFAGSPFAKVLELAENADQLERGASALERVAGALEAFSSIRLNRSRVDFTSLAIDLGTAIPLLRGLATGGIVTGITNRPMNFEGGLLDPNLRLDEVGNAATSLSRAFAAFSMLEIPPPRQRLDMRTLAENFNAAIPIVRNLSRELPAAAQAAETQILPRDFGESIIGITSGILNALERMESDALSGTRNIIVNNAPVIAPNVQNNQRGGTQVNQINGNGGMRGSNSLDPYLGIPLGVH